MLRAILNKSWRLHPTKQQLCDHLSPITKTFEVRWTRRVGHCWRTRDKLLWTPSHGRAKTGLPARISIQQFSADTGCSPEDLPEAIDDREGYRESFRDIRTDVTFTDAGQYETLTTLYCSGTKRLFTSWVLVFRHGEWETQFLLCWLFLHRPSINPQLDWPGPAQSQISTNAFFQKSPKIPAPRFQAWRHSHPSHISYRGFLLWDLWLSYPLSACVNCIQCVHMHLY